MRSALTSYYLPDRILNRRWFGPIVVLILLVFYIAHTTFQTAQLLGYKANIWDVVVTVLNGRLLVHHGLNNLYIYLISNLTLLGESGSYLILRIGSRSSWFRVQFGCVILVASLYLALIVIILGSVNALSIPWSLSWSSAAAPLLLQEGLSPERLLVWAPTVTAVSMMLLLGLFWIGIGIVVTTVTLATQKAVFGFLAGLALNYSTLIIWLADLDTSLLDTVWLHDRIFLWSSGNAVHSLMIRFTEQILYWLLWIILNLVILWHVCRSTDILHPST